MACSLLFAPAEPGADSDGGTKGDASVAADATPLCKADGFRWSIRQPIAFAPAAAVEMAQLDVPVGIRFTPDNFTDLQLPDDPSSLRFVEAGGNLMPHEVEAWAPDVGGLVWVLVSSYPGTGDELGFDMFHGDPEASSFEQAETLWLTARYSAVFHFNRDTFKDSMSPGVTADISPGVTAAEINEDGGFGHATRFLGLDTTTVLMDHSESHQSEDPFSMSLEARFRPTHLFDRSRFVIQKPGAYSITASTSTTDLSLATVSMPEGEVSSIGKVLAPESWTHAAMNVDAIKPEVAYFLDGTAPGLPTAFVGPRATSTERLTLGSYFQGDMDELRISSELRPARWFILQTALFTGNLQSFGEPVPCAP